MDDIAGVAGVSKKTIYKSFEDKHELVNSVVRDLILSHDRLFEESRVTAQNAIDEVIRQDSGPLEILTNIRHSFFYDLEKFFPSAWDEIERYKLRLHNSIIRNLEWGTHEEFYRYDIDKTFIADLRLYQLGNCLQPQFITTQKWGLRRLLLEFTRLYLYSITTEKGKNLLDVYLEKQVTDPIVRI